MPGILLLAHGGPGSLEDLPAFLGRLRGGRPCSQKLLDEVREKYSAIGGGSPLPAITFRTATKLKEACGLPVYVGMLHWPPLLEEAISQMVRDGVTGSLVICLVPQFSQASVGRYRQRTAAAAEAHGLAFDFVDSWHTLPPYVEGLAESVTAALVESGPQAGSEAHVIFSAHSLPKRALPLDDPYEAQLRETANAVAARLALAEERCSIAYQGAGDPEQDWLGPSVHEVIRGLSEQGETRAVLCPFGFLTDQVEILYDLDVVMKKEAEDLGIVVTRTPLLNDGPAVIDSLGLLVNRWRG